MKLRKRKLFSSIAFVLSLVMLAVSGAVFIHSATQQSASTSLSVTFSGENVDFTANGWYQVKNTASHPYLVNGNGTEGITIHATDASTTTSLSTPANTSVELSASNTYVLFTYKFTNTASSGAFGMEVSLANSAPLDNNIDVKYLVSSANATDYYPASATDNEKISALDEKVSAVTGTTAFSNVFIQAGHFKYFYILVSLKDNTLSGTYNNTLSWSVVCSSEIEEVSNTATLSWRLEKDSSYGFISLHYEDYSSSIVYSYDYEAEGSQIFDKGTTIIVGVFHPNYGYEEMATLKINNISTTWDSFVENVPQEGPGQNQGPSQLGATCTWTYTFTLNEDTHVLVQV